MHTAEKKTIRESANMHDISMKRSGEYARAGGNAAPTNQWKDYLFGERMYIVLSLLAKTALAWQIWFGTLRP